MRPNNWSGQDGSYWAAHDERYDALLAPLTAHLLPAAQLHPADEVLDVGCGCGNTTRLAARATAAALGVDLSEAMLATARRRAAEAGLANVRFDRADAQVTPVEPVDVVLSQLGVMFFADPVAAFTNLRRALRPTGRLAFVCWQELARNENRLVKQAVLGAHLSLPEPSTTTGALSLADPARVREVLTRAGFTDVSLIDVREPLLVGPTAEAATEYELGSPMVAELLAEVDADTAARAADALRAAYAERETPSGVWLESAAWLVTARPA